MAKTIDLANLGSDGGNLVAMPPGDGADQFVGSGASSAIIVPPEDLSGPALQWAWLQTQYASAFAGASTAAVGQSGSVFSTGPTPTATPLATGVEPSLAAIGSDPFAVPPTAAAPPGQDGGAAPQGGAFTNPETVTLSGSGLVFVNSYGSAVTTAYHTAILAAENELQSHFINAVTINVSFDFGPLSGGFIAFNNFFNTQTVSYTTLKNALTSHATSADDLAAVAALPAAAPSNSHSSSGTTGFEVTAGMARILGLEGPSNTTDDNLILSNSITWNFDPNNRGAAGGYDAIGAIEHEISEGGMGRVGGLGYQNNTWAPLDLFRFNSSGVRDETGGQDGVTTYFSPDGKNPDLTLNYHNSVNASGTFDKLDTGDWDQSGDAFGSGVEGKPDLLSNTDLRVMDVLGWTLSCFCRGTTILGEHGEVAVEDLKVGDRVRLLSGALKPIVWIGMGRDLVTRGNRMARPVIVRRGALADGVPCRDLYLTHGHALYLDGVLIPVENLVNHRSILWDDAARVVEYYHIELEDHDVVMAEGAPAETYYDANNRAQFLNTRQGSKAGVAKPAFAPVLNGGDVVDRVWSELFRRSGGRIATDTTDDPDLHLIVDGARLNPAAIDGAAYNFALAGQPGGALLLRSRSGVPSLLGITRHDHRRLGVALAGIELHQSGIATSVDYDAALLAEAGCYPAEGGYCWTDGEVVLPADLFVHLGGPFALIVHTERPGMRYPLAAPLPRAA